LEDSLGDAAIEAGRERGEFVVRREMEGGSAKDLNRALLVSPRRIEKRTRLRAEWTAEDGTVHKFFDYVLKKSKPIARKGTS